MIEIDKIKLLIVDDCVVIHTIVTTIIARHKDIEVVGFAVNGQEAIDKAASLKPDLILMDIMMPGIDGFTATKEIMENTPTPIIIFSSLVEKNEKEIACKALAIGALGVLPKRESAGGGYGINEKELVNIIRSLSTVHVFKRRKSYDASLVNMSRREMKQLKVIALGVSTGGPEVLTKIIKGLRINFTVPIVIVIHITEGMLMSLISFLQNLTNIEMVIAKDDEHLEANKVYFAPDHKHTLITRQGESVVVSLDDSPPVGYFKPAINKLFQSLADNYPKESVSGILTGMGDDGTEGMLAMRKNGCLTFAQSKETCVVSSMPDSARAVGATNISINLDNIADFLNDLALLYGDK